MNCLAKWWPELEVNPITDADRATLIEQICYGSYGARELKDKPVTSILRDWLLAEQLAVLDGYLPERIEMANGRRARLTYSEGRPAGAERRASRGFTGELDLHPRPVAGCR